MKMCTSALSASALIACTGVVSHASVFFTFADDNNPLEVRHESNTGALTYGDAITPPVFQFQVDATQDGGVLHTYNATLEWNLTVGAVQSVFGIDAAPVTGTFVFRDADAASKTGGADVILSGDIGEGTLVLGDSGSVLSASGSGLTYSAGPRFLEENPLILALVAPLDGVYTLTDVTFDTTRHQIGNGQETFFGDFSANAAFTGTAESALVPSPGAIALGFVGAGVAARRRRTRA